MKRLSRWLLFFFAGLVLFPSDGSTQAPYYAGKTITVIEGNSAGGVADLREASGSNLELGSWYYCTVDLLPWRPPRIIQLQT
jgi:hypothetical protein